MVENCGIAIFLFGNKKNEKIASGVLEEYKLAKDCGLVCLPIGCTGGAAEEIFNRTKQEIMDENIISVIEQANEQVDDVFPPVENIIQAIKMLNKEVF